MHKTVLILDYGSQYTQLIARRIRELGVYSLVVSGSTTLERIEQIGPSALILSGGPNSVYEPGAPTLPAGLLEYQKRMHIPLLGVCYGMQLLVKELGGEVGRAHSREYGKMQVHRQSPGKIQGHLPGGTFFGGKRLKNFDGYQVWMSHGDETKQIPPGFELTLKSAVGAVAAMEDSKDQIYGIQFHPEVTHTEHGLEILAQFIHEIAGIKSDWTMASVKQEQVAKIRAQVGPTAHVICALSGGVDSTVAAKLVHEAIGDRLHCVFVDTGLLRFKEAERVMQMFEGRLHLPVECVDSSQRFLSKLEGVSDPEQKRKIIGTEFIRVFEDEAINISKRLGVTPEYLVQGTLYPDVIESSPAPSSSVSALPGDVHGKKHSATIKSHHNVGGLPKDMRFKLIEPLRDLFKDEVRKLGAELGAPKDFLERHPFPGPGLAVRVISDITPERLEILRNVDEVFISAIRAHGLYNQIWQAFAVFLPVKTVGVQGDGRTHDHVVALRAVTSSDGMTADWFPFSHEFLAHVSNRICNEVRGVNRVVYDISSKPPATIEWE